MLLCSCGFPFAWLRPLKLCLAYMKLTVACPCSESPARSAVPFVAKRVVMARGRLQRQVCQHRTAGFLWFGPDSLWVVCCARGQSPGSRLLQHSHSANGLGHCPEAPGFRLLLQSQGVLRGTCCISCAARDLSWRSVCKYGQCVSMAYVRRICGSSGRTVSSTTAQPHQ